MEETVHYLFSYGTLQFENVQLENYGRTLSGSKDVLNYYKLEQVEITNKEVLTKSKQRFHPIAIPSKNKDDFIEGVIFEITAQELQQTDDYEVSDYKRVLALFESGKKAWIYISTQNTSEISQDY